MTNNDLVTVNEQKNSLLRKQKMKRFIYIGTISIMCILGGRISVAHGLERSVSISISISIIIEKFEIRKQQFKAQYAEAIPGDINDVLHNISISDASAVFSDVFNSFTAYLPTTAKALARQYAADATADIAHLSPGQAGFNVSASALANLVTSNGTAATAASSALTTIFSDDFESGLGNWVILPTSSTVLNTSVGGDHGLVAWLKAGTPSITHTFTLSALSNITTSFDYNIISTPETFYAVLDAATPDSTTLLSTNDTTSGWTSFSTTTNSVSSGDHMLTFSTGVSGGEETETYVDNVLIQSD